MRCTDSILVSVLCIHLPCSDSDPDVCRPRLLQHPEPQHHLASRDRIKGEFSTITGLQCSPHLPPLHPKKVILAIHRPSWLAKQCRVLAELTQ